MIEKDNKSQATSSTFSVLRVAGTVLIAMALIVPALLYFKPDVGNIRRVNRFARAGTPRTVPPFDLSKAAVPLEQILSAGPPKDGIPALTEPKFVKSEDVNFLSRDDRVIDVDIEEIALVRLVCNAL